jgi:hypothetical protein
VLCSDTVLRYQYFQSSALLRRMEEGPVAVLPRRGSLFAFPLTGFFPGHLNHMSNKLEKRGLPTVNVQWAFGGVEIQVGHQKDKRDSFYVLA